MDSTITVLSAALAFCEALIAEGPNVHADVAHLVALNEASLQDALREHPEKLIDRRDEIAAALASLAE